MVNCYILQYAQRGVGVAILISTDGIKVISPDSQVSKFVCSLACRLFINITVEPWNNEGWRD